MWIAILVSAISSRRSLSRTLRPLPGLFQGSDTDALIAFNITTLIERDPPWYLLPAEREQYRRLMFFSYAFHRFNRKSDDTELLQFSDSLFERSTAGAGLAKIQPADRPILDTIYHTEVINGYHSPRLELPQLARRAAQAATQLLHSLNPNP